MRFYRLLAAPGPVLIWLSGCVVFVGCDDPSPPPAEVADSPCTALPRAEAPADLTTAEWNTWMDARDAYYLRHGCYSKEYLSDWATLPTGKEKHWQPQSATAVQQRNEHFYPWGSGLHHLYVPNNSPFVHIADLNLDVWWKTVKPGTRTTLIHVEGYKYVLVENIEVRQRGESPTVALPSMAAAAPPLLPKVYVAKDTLHIKNCENVIVRNSYLAGAVTDSHIKIEGCKNVFVDNVEIDGLKYNGSSELASGQGILIDNCGSKPADASNPCRVINPLVPSLWTCAGKRYCSDVVTLCEGDTQESGYYQSPCPAGVNYTCCKYDMHALNWLIIQNCYVHGHQISQESKGNQDGISVVSAANGVAFNNVVEDWGAGGGTRPDGAIEIDHNRYCDPSYSDNFFRVERNMVLNCDTVKTVGLSDGTNEVLFVNNIFLNVLFLDYHKRHDNYVVHNTFVYTDHYHDDGELFSFYKQDRYWFDGATVMRNNLIYVDTDLMPESGTLGFDWLYQTRETAAREVATSTIPSGFSAQDFPSPDYNVSSGEYGTLTSMVKPDYHLYVGNLTRWALEEKKVEEYDASNSCTLSLIQPDVEISESQDLSEWQGHGGVMNAPQATMMARDAKSVHIEEECFVDVNFTMRAPHEFVPSECAGLASFGTRDALNIHGTAPFAITQGFLGGDRTKAGSLKVGAIQIDIETPPTVPPPVPEPIPGGPEIH